MSEANNKFDIDLSDGILAEKQMMRILSGSKVEVKNDFFIDKTGNIAVEFMCWGKPSGISVTESDWYAIFLGNAGSDICVMIKTSALKELSSTFYKRGMIKHGGDQEQSKFILIPWKEIINISNYGQESERWKKHGKK